MSETAISVEDARAVAIEALSIFATRAYLEREPLSRLLVGLKVHNICMPEPTIKACRGCQKVKPISNFPDVDSRECFPCGIGDTRARQEWHRRRYRRDWVRTRRAAIAG